MSLKQQEEAPSEDETSAGSQPSEENITERSSFLPASQDGEEKLPPDSGDQMAQSGGTVPTQLEICLARAANPLEGKPTPSTIDEIVSLCSTEHDGTQRALAFLAYKIQSPAEYEALHSLEVMELLVRRGGFRIVDEIGRFRFLNEIIKVVSPKYLGNRTAPKVKQRIIELIFAWSMEYKELPKIFEAYQMLKVQKIVTEDPVHVLKNFRPPTPPPPRPRDELFDNEDTVRTLRALLDSGSPYQLEIANRIIQTLADRAEARAQIQAEVKADLEQMHNCSQLLLEMVNQAAAAVTFDPTAPTCVLYKGAREDEVALMRELAENCEQSRVRLFKMAHTLEEIERGLAGATGADAATLKSKDSHLNRLVEIADQISVALNAAKEYFDLVEGKGRQSGKDAKMLDLSASFGPSTSKGKQHQHQQNRPSTSKEAPPFPPNPNTSERLLDLNCSPIRPATSTRRDSLENLIAAVDESLLSSGKGKNQQSAESFGSLLSSGASTSASKNIPPKEKKPEVISKDPLDDLKSINEMLKQEHLERQLITAVEIAAAEPSPVKSPTGSVASFTFPGPSSSSSSQSAEDSLTRLLTLHSYIAPSGIIPSSSSSRPLIIHARDQIQVALHYTGNRPHPQVLVFLVTISNGSERAISGVQFVAAVAKDIKAKLLAQSGTWLPAFGPVSNLEGSQRHLLPTTTVISQVLLIAFNGQYLERNMVELTAEEGMTPPATEPSAGSSFDFLSQPVTSAAVGYLFRLKYKLTYNSEEDGGSKILKKYEYSGYFNWLVPKGYLDSGK